MSEENTALTTRPNAIIGVNMRELNDVSALIFQSKVFGDLQSKEAAAIKVLSGLEYGFTPFQSMAMFDFIQGRPTLNAHGKATLINSSGDFRLKIKELTNKNCAIEVCRKNGDGQWKVVNTSTFSWDDAELAGYTKGKNAHSYAHTPRNMLFARCVSNIWRWDCAELNMRKLAPSHIVEFEAPELNEEPEVQNGNRSDIEPSVVSATEIIDGELVNTSTGEVFESEEDAERAAIESDGEGVMDRAESTLIDLRVAAGEAYSSTQGEARARANKWLGKGTISELKKEGLLQFLEAFPNM